MDKTQEEMMPRKFKKFIGLVGPDWSPAQRVRALGFWGFVGRGRRRYKGRLRMLSLVGSGTSQVAEGIFTSQVTLPGHQLNKHGLPKGRNVLLSYLICPLGVAGTLGRLLLKILISPLLLYPTCFSLSPTSSFSIRKNRTTI